MIGNRTTVWALARVPATDGEVLRFPVALPTGAWLIADDVMFRAESNVLLLSPAAIHGHFTPQDTA